MPVTGVGGLFFRARDPSALASWYRTHLNVGAGCDGTGGTGAESAANQWVWQAAGGPTVFAPFPADSDYFPADRTFMLNLRVSELNGLIAALRAAGIAVETRAEWDDPATGRFARVHDLEGNPVELWEPAG